MLTSTEWLGLVIIAALAVVVVIALISARVTRRRHAELRQRFGPEYDRALEEHRSATRAERELLAREKRVEQLHLRPLSESERIQYGVKWEEVQARFVDDPSSAVQAADDLIKAVMGARGYVVERFEQRVADLSVEHARVVQHYRAARELSGASREGYADTEDLRQAFVHYRALFSDLLEQPEHLDPQLREYRHDDADQTTPGNLSPEVDEDLDEEREASYLTDDTSTQVSERWQHIQSEFVDDPRRSVTEAHQLVGELMQRIADNFTRERDELERQWSAGSSASTEDLRICLQRYRDFFSRLLPPATESTNRH